jgi:hypothetical protein
MSAATLAGIFLIFAKLTAITLSPIYVLLLLIQT